MGKREGEEWEEGLGGEEWGRGWERNGEKGGEEWGRGWERNGEEGGEEWGRG